MTASTVPQPRVRRRLISHSEIATVLDCQAKHDFSYVGALAGSALKPKTTPVLLREGRAWGRAVATWHETGDVGLAHHVELNTALAEDAEKQQTQGVDEHEQTVEKLRALLDHYTTTTERLPINRLEHELEVPIPSRTGRRRSNTYRLSAFIDGIHTDDEGRAWIVEFKLRKQLSAFWQIALARQTRWYAWAWREQTGIEPAGIIVDERLNATPAPVKLNKDGTPSKVQTCTLDAYIDAWQHLGTQPNEDVVAQLAGREWQQRHPLILRPGELDEAGAQLVSAARLIHRLDTGLLYPIRNPSRARCPGCAFKDICPEPQDTVLVDALYERVEAKRDRKKVAA